MDKKSTIDADYLPLLWAALVLAWLPLLRPYQWITDDYVLANTLDSGWLAYVQESLKARGVWRFLQYAFTALLLKMPGSGFGFLALIVHCGAATGFYLAAARFFRAETALMAALIAFGFPWGLQAVWWASAFVYAVIALLFWVLVALFLTGKHHGLSQRALAAGGFCISLLAFYLHEGLIFAFVCVPLLLWLPLDKSLIHRCRHFWAGWAVVAAAAIYLLTYHFFYSSQVKQPVDLRWQALFAAIYYQYTNVAVFVPWFSRPLREQIFLGWTPWHGMAAAVLVLLVAWSFFKVLLLPRQKQLSMRESPAFIWLILIGVAIVYVFSGGYALDSRKKYLLVPIVVLVVAACLRMASDRQLRKSVWGGIVGLLILAGTATTWLQLGIWRYETDCYSALTRAFSQYNIVRVKGFERIPNAYVEWPGAENYWGERLDQLSAVRFATRYAQRDDPVLDSREGWFLVYNLKQRKWVPGPCEMGQ